MEAASNPVLDRVEQRRRYGLDCGDPICFKAGSWSPGGEHVQKLTVRNISQRSVKFKYDLPSTKYFSMNFPTATTLSPGMLTTLHIVFRPVKLEEYEDSVGFHVHVLEGGVAAISGRFRVPVVARIATLKVDIPHGLDFGFCPTKETTVQTFVLCNSGQIDAMFNWTVPTAGEHGTPFVVQPEAGCVKSGASIVLTASFCPTTASVYVVTTTCTVKPETNESLTSANMLVETMKISGISKFTHLSASETELNFGDVLVGSSNASRVSTEKDFILRNRSLVRASYIIKTVESDHDPRFIFSSLNGVIDAESAATINVRYTPLSAGEFTCDHFDIITPGGNRVRLTCKGRATGPLLTIWRKNRESNFVSTRSVNFHDVQVGSNVVSRVITLRNGSSMDIFFHFDAQSQSVFSFDRVAGIVPPFLDINITISFSPPHAGNFYRRFFLLQHNQNTQYVDVLGTGYDGKTRPSPFQQAHIDAYRLRAAAGLGHLSPDELETYHKENGDDLFLKGALQRATEETNTELSARQLPSPSQMQTRSGEAFLTDIEICTEYFTSITDKVNPIIVQGALLDFGSCGIVQFPSKKILHVTNNTHSKVTCLWHVAVAPGPPNTENDQPVFQVFPSYRDIAAGATVEFRVAFQPTRFDAYYFAELEAFVSFKSNRTFRLVNVDTFTPPWCMVVKTCGNTFSSATEQFLSKVSFRLINDKVHFPPCYVGDSVFQTIMIENASDTPALFSFVDDPAEVFSVKPPCGYIEAKSFHLVAIRFTPRQVKKYSHHLQCVVNNGLIKPEVIDLIAICATPQLSFQDIERDQLLPAEAKVYIKPTAIGLHSHRQIELINTSRVPLVYRWELPPKCQRVFRVNPKLGRLNGKETISIECSFIPDDIREYFCRFLVTVKPISVPFNQRNSLRSKIPVLQELKILVQTTGTTGAIIFHPETVHFEPILINSSSKESFLIENTADADLTYTLQQTVVSDTPDKLATRESAIEMEGHESAHLTSKLGFSHAQGSIPAKSRKKITATFSPTTAGFFTFKVSCLVGQPTSSPMLEAQEHKQATCTIRAEASFPTITIQDVRVPGLSTRLVWYQFQCNEINAYLAAPEMSEEQRPHPSVLDVEDTDLTFPESDELETEVPLRRFVFPFYPSPLGSCTERVFIKLHNPGNLVVQYHLRYPKEGNVEIEHWAETGVLSADDARLNATIDSKVFEVLPRQATLLPRQSTLLTLSYSYTWDAYGGEHNLPLFFEVEKGKKMVIELQGRTLLHKGPKLFLPTPVYHLSPVTIGEFRRGLEPPQAKAQYAYDDNDDKDPIDSMHHRVDRPAIQQIQVFNRGDSALRLEVESALFKRVNDTNFEYPVLVCMSKSEIIPASSSVFLDIEFNPIQVGTIEAPLLLQAHGLMGNGYKETIEATVVATGYNSKQSTLQQIRNELQGLSMPPKRQFISISGYPARFVSDYVDFGHVPMHSEVNQLLVLYNESSLSDVGNAGISAHSFEFEWDTLHPLVANGTITFSPNRGELKPGDKILIRVTVYAGVKAFVVNHDVACLITYIKESGDDCGGDFVGTSAIRSVEHQQAVVPSKEVRTSVVNRSVATVAYKRDISVTNSTAMKSNNDTPVTLTPSPAPVRSTHSSSRKVLSRFNSGDVSSSDTRQSNPSQAIGRDRIPLFVRIYAHMLPIDVIERMYPREELKKLPLPITKQMPRALSLPIYSVNGMKIKAGKSVEAYNEDNSRVDPHSNGIPLVADGLDSVKCRDVLYDVMEALTMDVLTSSVVQEAMRERVVPLPRSDRALKQATISEGANAILPSGTLHYKSRHDDDCQTIIAQIMENTMFNILQELFYGDLEHELRCVPRNAIFPNG